MTINIEEIRNFKKHHFYTRLMERFALTMTAAEFDALAEQIEDYNPKPLLIEEDGKSFHMVTISGQQLIVLYDWDYKVMLTCYHHGWLAQNEHGQWEQVKRYKSKNIRKFNYLNTKRRQGKI